MDVSRFNEIGWKAKMDLENGIKETYKWFLEHTDQIKEVKI